MKSSPPIRGLQRGATSRPGRPQKRTKAQREWLKVSKLVHRLDRQVSGELETLQRLKAEIEAEPN